jgi:hypothetical protein
MFHVTEEYLTGWQEWARRTRIVVPATSFVIANALLVLIAVLLARG